MKLLTITDLRYRWSYTKSGVHKLSKTEGFPKPLAIVSRGKIKIYGEEDIKAYEKNKPWLFDEDLKIKKQKAFFVSTNCEKLEYPSLPNSD